MRVSDPGSKAEASRLQSSGRSKRLQLLYGEVCNAVRLALHPSPFDRLVVVLASDQYLIIPYCDYNIAIRRIVMTSYPYCGNHECPSN